MIATVKNRHFLLRISMNVYHFDCNLKNVKNMKNVKNLISKWIGMESWIGFISSGSKTDPYLCYTKVENGFNCYKWIYKTKIERKIKIRFKPINLIR